MATDRPTAIELIESVKDFLGDEALPSLSGHMAFQVRVAANLLAIAQRELEEGPRMRRDEHQRLREILGKEGSLEDLEAELIGLIREGDLDSNRDAVVQHLRRTSEDRLRIANPKYLQRG